MVSPTQSGDALFYGQLTISKLQLNKRGPEPWPVTDGAAAPEPSSPNEWFSRKFPAQAKIYGSPFIELLETSVDGLTKINPLAPNIDFFAAMLGGDSKLGHQVVYVEGELTFYFYDPRDRIFKPTSEDKLGNLLRAYLARCAEELPDSVFKLKMFTDFRSNKTIREVVHRAKSILAADHTFFSVESNHARQKGPEVHERIARIFAEQVLERQPGEILTLTNAYLLFTEFLRQKSMIPVKRPLFKGIFAPLIREVYDLGLRNDVIDQHSQKQTAGWKGLHSLSLETVAARN